MRYHKLPRLYVENELNVGEQIRLPKPASHYLVSVMRRKLTDNIILFNGKAGEFLAEITEANKSAASIKIVEKTRGQAICPNITLIYSPVKNVKSEYIVQKATELGASKIQPCVFERTIRPKVKEDKLKAVAIEAAEQCERLDIPHINELIDFANLLPEIKDKNIIFCDETGQGKPASEALSALLPSTSNMSPRATIPDLSPRTSCGVNGKEFIILIGPEGGFSDDEIKQIYELPNAAGIGLGPRILRADTAIIAALTLTQNYLGDFDSLPDFRL